MGVFYREFQFLVDRNAVFDHLAASTTLGMNIQAGESAEHLQGMRVSQEYFHVLGVPPWIGRDFRPDEDQLHGPAVVILSHELWMRRFGSDRGILGQTVLLDGEPTTVIGVMPEGFQSIPTAEAWSTLAQVSHTVGSGENLEMIGRLHTGVSLAEANARSAVCVRRLQARVRRE